MGVSTANRVAIALLGGYRRTFGLLLGGSCRFTPTCSQYAIDCFSRHGFRRALVLTAWRLLRCHPWCEGGKDPAP